MRDRSFVLFFHCSRGRRGQPCKPCHVIDHRRGEPQRLKRSWLCGLLAATMGLINATQAVAEEVCRPVLTFAEVQFSEMQPPTLERRWSAIVSVDASRCAANSSGSFEIVFRRLKEIGLELEFRDRFTWVAPSVKVAVDFWADEAVEVKGYRIDNVEPCRCRD